MYTLLSGSMFTGDWIAMLLASFGGALVAFGLVVEKFADFIDDRFLGEYKPHKNLELFGWCVLMFGIFIEIADAGWTGHELFKNDPLNRPVRTVSAHAHILIKGVKWVQLPPEFKDDWLCGITFGSGTNALFSLSSKKDDVSMYNMLGTVQKNRTDLGYDIDFHQNHFEEPGMGDWAIGQPLRTVNDVDSFVISTRDDFDKFFSQRLLTNTEIISGTIELTVNSSMTWEFPIPPQKQKFGFISGRIATNAANKNMWEIRPFHVIDATGKDVGDFDGK